MTTGQGKLVGHMPPERLHELGHLTELRNIYEHMHDSFWEGVRRELGLLDVNMQVDADGNIWELEETP